MRLLPALCFALTAFAAAPLCAAQNVRVLIASGALISVNTAPTSAAPGSASGPNVWKIGVRGGKLTLGGQDTGSALLSLPANVGGTLEVAGHRYRGGLILRATPGGVQAINVVNLEDYLRGVVPAEMPPLWAAAAVRAQAIIARTYAAARINPAAPYDLCATTQCQVYEGVAKEHPLSDAAILDTRAQVVSSGGKLADTYFSADSGGYTASSLEAWGRDVPYLKAQPDPTSPTAQKPWVITAALSSVQDVAARYGVKVGALSSVSVSQASGSGRVTELSFVRRKRHPDARRGQRGRLRALAGGQVVQGQAERGRRAAHPDRQRLRARRGAVAVGSQGAGRERQERSGAAGLLLPRRADQRADRDPGWCPPATRPHFAAGGGGAAGHCARSARPGRTDHRMDTCAAAGRGTPARFLPRSRGPTDVVTRPAVHAAVARPPASALRRRAAALLAGLLALGLGSAQARTVRIIQADRLELNKVDDQEIVVISGERVELRVDNDVVVATRVEFNRSRRTLTLIGPGRYDAVDDKGAVQHLVGSDLVVNLSNQAVSGEDVIISDADLEIRGEAVERVPGQLSAQNSYFTPCAKCGRTPNDYAFKAKRLLLYPGDRLIGLPSDLAAGGRAGAVLADRGAAAQRAVAPAQAQLHQRRRGRAHLQGRSAVRLQRQRAGHHLPALLPEPLAQLRRRRRVHRLRAAADS